MKEMRTLRGLVSFKIYWNHSKGVSGLVWAGWGHSLNSLHTICNDKYGDSHVDSWEHKIETHQPIIMYGV